VNRSEKDNRPLTEEESVFIEKLITENRKTIKNIIHNVLGEEYRQLAEDTIYEVYLLMCQKIDVLTTHSNPKAWIFVASRFVAKNAIRNNRKYRDNVPINAIENLASDMNVEEEAIFRMWLSNNTPKKLTEVLTKRETQVYQKLYIEYKTPKQAAEELNIKVSTVNNINKNIKDKLFYALKNKK